MMTDELFSDLPVSASPNARLDAARARYEVAILAVKTAHGPDVKTAAKEMFAATNELEQAEREAYAAARGIKPRRIEE